MRPARRFALLPLVVGAVLAPAVPLAAQDPTLPDAVAPADTVPGRVAGHVLRVTASGERPLAGQWVVLHRIDADGNGRPLDSTRTTTRGEFALRYPRVGMGAQYFVSTVHHGIAYLSDPLPKVSGGETATIPVYDTTSVPIGLHTQGRHIIVFAPDASPRSRVVEIHTVSNDTVLTRVTPPTGPPVWSAVLPPRAEAFANGPPELTTETVSVANARVISVAPFAPGVKRFAFTYELPPRAFPISLPMQDATIVLEVLVEDPAATVSAPGLEQVSPMAIAGRNLRRFRAQDVPEGAVVTIQPGAVPSTRPATMAALALLLGSVMAVALLVAVRKGRLRPAVPVRSPPVAAAPREDDTEVLARRIVAMDAEFAARAEPTDIERRRYESERQELKRTLAARLAARPGA